MYNIVFILTVILFLIMVIPKIARSKWWKNNITPEFPEVHPSVCFDCHKQNCHGCVYNK